MPTIMTIAAWNNYAYVHKIQVLHASNANSWYIKVALCQTCGSFKKHIVERLPLNFLKNNQHE